MKVGIELALQVIEALKEIYIFNYDKQSLAFGYSVAPERYLIGKFEENSFQPLMDPLDKNAFADWLSEQTDESLEALAKNKNCTALTIDTLVNAVQQVATNTTGLAPGPYRIEHPKGGYYTVPAVHFACYTKDQQLFDEAIKVSTPEERQKPYVDGRSALATACASGFIYGVEKLIALDGYQCNFKSVCLPLHAAIENNKWAIVSLFKNKITNEETLTKSVAPYWEVEKQAELRRALSLPEFKTPFSLNYLLRDDSVVLSTAILRQLDATPYINLNLKDDEGLTPFLRFLSHSSFSFEVFKRMLEMKADPQTEVNSKSAIDLIFENSFAEDDGKKALQSLYFLGVRSMRSGPTGLLRNLKAKFGIL